MAESRAKGNANENAVCRPLSRWLGPKKADPHYYDDCMVAGLPFRRRSTSIMPSSGSWEGSGDILHVAGAKIVCPFRIECFGAETLVFTRRGMIPICDVRVGDKVLTHLGRFKSVTSVMHKKSLAGSLRVDSQTESICVTGEHPFEGFYGEWVEAKDVAISAHSTADLNGQTMEAKWLSIPRPPTRVLSTPAGNGKVYCGCGCGQTIPSLDRKGRKRWYVTGHNAGLNAVELPRRIRLTEDIAYLLGLYIAEGHCRPGGVAWTFHRDEKDFQDSVSQLVLDHFGLTVAIQPHVDTLTTDVVVSSVRLRDAFMEWLGTGSHKKHLGRFLLLPKNLLIALLRGCFDGDGCWGDGYVKYNTVSRRLAFDVQAALLRLRIYSRVYRNARGCYEVAVARSGISRFYAVVLKGENPTTIAAAEHLRPDIHDSAKARIFVRGASFEAGLVERDVYNLSIADDETYVIEGGIVVHNCKKYEGWELDGLMYRSHIDLWSWWNQAKGQADSGFYPLLVFTRNHRPMYSMLETSVAQCLKLQPSAGPVLNVVRRVKSRTEQVTVSLLEDLIATSRESVIRLAGQSRCPTPEK